MQDYQTIIFFDEEVFLKSQKRKKQKLILNFRSEKLPELVKGVKIQEEIYYFEIDLEKSFEIITKQTEKEYNKLEKYCFHFLSCLLEERNDSFICFLQKEFNISREELYKMEIEYDYLKKKTQTMKNKIIKQL